jgi:hypothetical protein
METILPYFRAELEIEVGGGHNFLGWNASEILALVQKTILIVRQTSCYLLKVQI